MKNPCENCGYYWREGYEKFPSCHFDGPHEWAPCEAADEADRIKMDRLEYEKEKLRILRDMI